MLGCDLVVPLNLCHISKVAGGFDLTERLTTILIGDRDTDLVIQHSDREDRVMQLLPAFDAQLIGACHVDDRFEPLLKLSTVMNGVAPAGSRGGREGGWYRQGLEVYSRAIVLGFIFNVYVCSAVIDLYMRMGFFDVGLRLFSGLHERSLGVWNLVLRGCCDLGRSSELFGVFSSMKKEGFMGNALTFCYMIRGCGNEEFVEEGKQLHCYVVKNGWCEVNVFVANALVDFYSACGCLNDAEKAFEVILLEDVISWNSMVAAYANNGFSFEAFEIFNQMQFWGKKPSVRSFVGLLTLCREENNLILGNQIHCFVIKTGCDMGSAYVQSALIDMYGKCGEIECSVSIFQGNPEISLESCNSMMTSLLQYNIVEDVVEMFAMMLAKGIRYDEVSVATTLKALSISSCASLMGCTMLHCCVIKSGFVSDSAVSCSLIDAYSRSGHVKSSHQIFEELPSVNVVSFTSIINAYARNGMGMQGLDMLKEMTEKGVKPDKVTFLCVLNGCNHSGLIEEGKMVFNLMKTVHEIHPDRKHYSCMVDLFGRAGLLEDAEELLKQAPRKDDSVLWSSLLRSCRIHRNEDVGRRVTYKLMDLEPEDPEIWLQASNFYAEIGEFDTSSHIREVAVARKMRMDIETGILLLMIKQQGTTLHTLDSIKSTLADSGLWT
ncbi:Pentatricopeptide repeat-containing protein [Heracleum sosnowskyi]|uniref:Pentatricopeptide repeat-containing protein n=1 Tax=Heracleum sosnowskyi TaxID=360622 RepID=A0AAD8JGL0_9APIA|nr:Pentatricopeptide repeat-containing protein [Heracleum sosnowskyi]